MPFNAKLDLFITDRQELADRSQRLRERAEFLSSAADAVRFDSAANIETENQRFVLLASTISSGI